MKIENDFTMLLKKAFQQAILDDKNFIRTEQKWPALNFRASIKPAFLLEHSGLLSDNRAIP